MKKIITCIVLVVILLSTTIIHVFAATSNQDGLEVSITTNQETYKADDEIEITLTATNTNNIPLTQVSLESIIPEGYQLVEGYELIKEVETLKAGETISLIAKYSTKGDVLIKDGNQKNEMTSTGDSTNIKSWIVLLVLGTAGILLIIVFKKKKRKDILLILICFSMFSSFFSTAIDVLAIENSNKLIEIKEDVDISGKKLSVLGKVGYCISQETKEKECTVTFESNGGSYIDSVKVKRGETLSIPNNPTKEGYVFFGWYRDSGFNEEFLSDLDIVNEDMILYAKWILDDEDTLEVEYVARQIIIGYQTGDYSYSVTRNISLPKKVPEFEDVNIVWKSSQDYIISTEGNVNRPNENTNVTLTATVSKGKVVKDIRFVLTVIHKRNSDISKIHNNSIIDIENMNETIPDIVYNDDQSQVIFIDGKYSDIVVNNLEDAIDVVQSVHSILGIDNPYEELEIVAISQDEYGAQYTFKQIYKGHEVYGRRVTISADKNGITDSLNSGFYLTKNLASMNFHLSIDEKTAKQTVVNKYSDKCQVKYSDDMMIYTFDKCNNNPSLSYIFNVSGLDQDDSYINDDVFVDSLLNQVVFEMSNLKFDTTVQGSGKNEQGQSVVFPVTKKRNKYYMMDNTLNITMKKNKITKISSSSNKWTDKYAVSAYTNARYAMNWWKNEFGRNSLDKNGMNVPIIINSGLKNNAAWYRGKIDIGLDDVYLSSLDHIMIGSYADDGKRKYSCAASVDNIVHETAHGVISFETGNSMPGALDEGYADVFGCLSTNSWLHGKGLYKDNIGIICSRNIADPYNSNAFQKGITKLSEYDSVKNDNHIRGMLISHAAYLMNSYGMSMKTLKKLWYKSISMGYDKTSKMITVRRNVITAAKEIGLSESDMAIIRRAFDEEEISDYGFLSGSVTDQEGKAIKYSSIFLYQGDRLIRNISTDFNGKFSNEKVMVGEYTIKVVNQNYRTYIGKVTVIKDNKLKLDIKLVRTGKGIIKGQIVNAIDSSHIPEAMINIRKGHNTSEGDIISKVTSDIDGKYQFELDTGYYTLEVSRNGFITQYLNATVLNDATTNIDVSLSSAMSNQLYRVVLTWDEYPFDLDSHLSGITGDGTSFHVYYLNKEEYKPNGTLIANLDIDDTDSYGPETITFNVDTEGTYNYYVHRFSSDGTLPASGANVKIYNGERLIKNCNIDASFDENSLYWNIFTIDKGIFKIVNTVSQEL